jgi:hypothetical protein
MRLLMHFLQPPITLSISGLNIPIRALFSNALSVFTVLTLCYFLTLIEYGFYTEFLQVSIDRDQLFLNKSD